MPLVYTVLHRMGVAPAAGAEWARPVAVERDTNGILSPGARSREEVIARERGGEYGRENTDEFQNRETEI